jgi:hypothetical protein
MKKIVWAVVAVAALVAIGREVPAMTREIKMYRM